MLPSANSVWTALRSVDSFVGALSWTVAPIYFVAVVGMNQVPKAGSNMVRSVNREDLSRASHGSKPDRIARADFIDGTRPVGHLGDASYPLGQPVQVHEQVEHMLRRARTSQPPAARHYARRIRRDNP
jgi:hypothetical protein